MNLINHLPKDIIILIEQYNVNHRILMKNILNELLSKYNHNLIIHSRCNNCASKSNQKFTKYIFWKKFSYCSDWCSFDNEYLIRNKYKNNKYIDKFYL
jgi:hypothetical protein